MHAPETLIYGCRWFDLWHVDPESDGSDDSCGYTYPRLSADELERVHKEGKGEFDFWLGKFEPLKRASTFEVLHAVWTHLAWRMDGRRRGRLSAAELDDIAGLASNPTDNLRHVVAEAKYNRDEFERLFVLVYRCYKLHHRRWYQHAKWHVRHWQFKFHIGRALKELLKRRASA